MINLIANLKSQKTKSKPIELSQDFCVADYLADKRFNTPEKQLLFKLRSRILGVKAHLKQVIVLNINYLNSKPSSIDLNTIYGSTEQKRMIIKIYSGAWSLRFQKLSDVMQIIV